MQLMPERNYVDTLPLLKDAWQLSHQNSEIGLLLAETQITLNRSEEVETVLKLSRYRIRIPVIRGWSHRSICLNR